MFASPIKVLIVDDDEDDYIITSELLGDIESVLFELDWESEYDSALGAIGSDIHDIYLIDYRLGRRNGLDLLKDALKLGCDRPIILLTGQGDREVDFEAMKAGASDYLIKGAIDGDALERAIRYSIERKRSEEARFFLEEQLLQSQKLESIGKLAGEVAHDFNNYLIPILGYSQLGLGILDPNDKAYGYFEIIENAGQRASELSRQLLAFSRQNTIERILVDTNELLHSIEPILRRVVGNNVDLVIIRSPNPAPVEIDPGQFDQVMVNLVGNARDAMPDGGALFIENSKVTVTLETQTPDEPPEPGEYILLTVRDTGVGIPVETQKHIFEAFFTTKPAGKGTGLGLSTCHGIVLQNNGYMFVESSPNCGTTFKFYLPYIQGDIQNQVYDSLHQDPMPRGSETVLLVEDETMVLDISASILGQQGYNVLKASDGSEAIQIAQKLQDGEIDLLLTDVDMPLISGWDLSIMFSKFHPDVPVVYTSGFIGDSIVNHGLTEDSHNFLKKPYSLSALAEKVRSALDNKVSSANLSRM